MVRPTRRLQVRLMRRLSVVAPRRRGRAAGDRRGNPHRQLRRGEPGGRRGTLRPEPGRGVDHHAARRRADSRCEEQSKFLVTIGACATSGGIQALRNFADVKEYTSIVYAHPEYISTLATSTAIADHVPVDFELRGCPIDKHQLIEVVGAFLKRRTPAIPTFSVCVECKRRGNTCIMVADGIPVWARSRRPGAVRSVPPTTGGATGASDRWSRPTWIRSPRGGISSGWDDATWWTPCEPSTPTPCLQGSE